MNSTVKPIRPDERDFVQYTRGYLKDQRSMARRSPAAWQVFTLLVERMNKGNALVISQATMAQILGYTRTTINSAVKLLEAEHWLQVVKIGQANGYLINSKVVWRDHSGKRYGTFNAQVVVSEDEQSRPVEDWENIELRHVPVLRNGEIPVLTDEDLPPPDQRELLPPDSIEFPKSNDAADRAELERKGQLRLTGD
jgi:biotin operon repressor